LYARLRHLRFVPDALSEGRGRVVAGVAGWNAVPMLVHWMRRPFDVVIGMGTDLIEIARIERSVERYGTAFLERIYTAGEIAYCQRKRNAAESFAARFAAKEAGAKALGTGISRGVSWREFEVRRQPGQRPELYLSGRAQEIAARLGIKRLSLSLSHSQMLSIAVVVAED
jgi:holo-[acyl-carrier protein] synthase